MFFFFPTSCRHVSPRQKKRKKSFSTYGSRVVPHLSTRQAQWCLTSEFGWDLVFPPWYDRMTVNDINVDWAACWQKEKDRAYFFVGDRLTDWLTDRERERSSMPRRHLNDTPSIVHFREPCRSRHFSVTHLHKNLVLIMLPPTHFP